MNRGVTEIFCNPGRIEANGDQPGLCHEAETVETGEIMKNRVGGAEAQESECGLVAAAARSVLCLYAPCNQWELPWAKSFLADRK